MIRLEKVNKYFNRHKKNEIHVINNTSLEFDKNGLVALLGPSGCGKTTLLNTIGGLDRINGGQIFINGERITKSSVRKIDRIRNINIGYIFQDYHLVNDMTVYDNVALVLRMIGIKDKDEIKKRVSYVLETVGMYRYRNRMANMLSGGERQRVGIARAIVKNPSIIIADEPTGNLDSKNTLEIMNIIKAISKDKLVILVTHEKDLAYFYASRIIELQDGTIISDKSNNHQEDLDYRIDNKIYLKDIKDYQKISSNNIEVNFYNDDAKKIRLDVVYKNGNIYLKSYYNDKVEVIDNNSNVEFVNDNYKKISKESYEKYQFDYEKIINKDITPKYSSILNIFTLIQNGFKKVFNYPILKKILLLGFFFSGMFILYAMSSILGTLNIKDEDFVTQNKNYINLISNNTKVEDVLKYEENSNINYILPGDSLISFNVKYNYYYQTNDITDNLNGSLSDINMISEKDLIYGRMPSNEYEIVVDKLAIVKMFDNNIAKQVGILKVSEMLGKEVVVQPMKNFKIVGITDLESPSIYTDKSMFINLIANSNNFDSNNYEYSVVKEEQIIFLDYNIIENDITIKQGRRPKNDYEVIVNINHKDEWKLNEKISTKINGKKLMVVGYYTSNEYDYLLLNSNTIKYYLITNKKNLVISSKNKDDAMNYFKVENINVKDSYQTAKDVYQKGIRDSAIATLIVSGVILSISLIEIFLMVRSSFLSRIKEVGILRAIGVKKSDIYKMFLGEILAITAIASTTGYLFMIYVLKTLVQIPLFADKYLLNPVVLISSIILIYGFNIVVGLLPVFNTIRKTPAAILSRTDID